MIPGRMRHIVTIERQTTATDAHGERVQTWAPLIPSNPTRRASIEPINGREYMTQSGEHSEVTARIRLRYDAELDDIQPKDRVNHDGVIYGIITPIKPNEISSELVLMAKRWGGDS
jgi:SPP1 family predicted phage head-tail adaptor